MSTTVCKLSLGPSKRCGAKFSFFRGFYLSESVKKVSEHSGSRILRVRVRPSSFRLTPGGGPFPTSRNILSAIFEINILLSNSVSNLSNSQFYNCLFFSLQIKSEAWDHNEYFHIIIA